MTILPKTKKSNHSNLKQDKYSNARGHVSPNHNGLLNQENYRYGGASATLLNSHTTSNIDVTSGAMSILGTNSSSVVKRTNRKGIVSSAGNIVTTSTLMVSTSGNIHHQQQQANICGSNTVTAPLSNTISAHSSVNACNSDDEYGSGFKDDELEIRFAERIKKARGLIIKEVKGDGACMFRAVADQIYGDEEMHMDVRTLCMDYIAKNRDHFSQFLTEDFDEYLARKRERDAHGNHVELQAISEIFLRPIEIFEYSIDPINTFHPISPEANTGVIENPPLRLSYHGTVHYNSVIDPFSATIGVGLGLPEFKPGLAEKNLMKEATLASESQHIEEAMLNDKLRMTDWERTEEELSRQIAKDSYLEYLRQLEQSSEERIDKNELHDNSFSSFNQGTLSNSNNGKITCDVKDNAKMDLSVKDSKNFLLFCSPTTSRGTSLTLNLDMRRLGFLGAKRGASSPNIPSSSRENADFSNENGHQNGSSSPLAKVQRDG